VLVLDDLQQGIVIVDRQDLLGPDRFAAFSIDAAVMASADVPTLSPSDLPKNNVGA
jgi:hypothetical protein